MRVFLRFLITYHGLPAGVVGAVPTIRQWKLASLPKHLSVEEVDRTLTTCDEQSPVGKRDRAILLLLVRLALRAGEVGRLRPSDIDWRIGEVRIPLPPKLYLSYNQLFRGRKCDDVARLQRDYR